MRKGCFVNLNWRSRCPLVLAGCEGFFSWIQKKKHLQINILLKRNGHVSSYDWPALISVAHSNLFNHFSKHSKAFKDMPALMQCIFSERSRLMMKIGCFCKAELKTERQTSRKKEVDTGYSLLQGRPRSLLQSACGRKQRELSASYRQQCTTPDQFPFKGSNTY